jgi:Tfp pilus assembly protein PilF
MILSKNFPVRLFLIFLLCALFISCKKKETPPPAVEETVLVQEEEVTPEETLPETPGSAAAANTGVGVSYSVQRPKQGLSSVGGRVNTREINPVNYENPDIEILKQMGAEPAVISYFTGEKFYKAGNYDKALIEYNAALVKDGEFLEAIVSRGNTWLKKKDYKRAIEDYTRAIKINSSRAELYNYRGYARAELAAGRTSELRLAIEDYSKAISITANYADALINRSQALLEIGEYRRVIDDCTRIIALEPKNSYAWNRRGSAWYALGDDDKAINDFSEAIKIRNNHASAWHNRGNAWYSKGDHEKALSDINRSISINPSYAEAYTSRGNIHRSLGNNESAAADFAEAKRLKQR